MTALERLTAYLCSRPGTEHMDAHHAEMASSILDQHAREIGRERDASYWRQRFENEANVRWDDGCPPGGMVCATCGEPVESEPCPEHNPKAILAVVQPVLDAAQRDAARLTRIAQAHTKYVDEHGGTTGECAECGEPSPCPTWTWATTERDPLATWDPADDEPPAGP